MARSRLGACPPTFTSPGLLLGRPAGGCRLRHHLSLRARDVVLVGVALRDGAPLALVSTGQSTVLGTRGAAGDTCDAAVDWGKEAAGRLRLLARTALLAGEMGAAGPDDEAGVRLIIILALDGNNPPEPPAHLRWATIGEMAEGAIRRFAVAALHRALTLRSAVIEAPTELITGAVSARHVPVPVGIVEMRQSFPYSPLTRGLSGGAHAGAARRAVRANGRPRESRERQANSHSIPTECLGHSTPKRVESPGLSVLYL